MDTSSYSFNQGTLVGGCLTFPNYDYVPPGQVVGEETIHFPSSTTSTIFLIGNAQTTATIFIPSAGKG